MNRKKISGVCCLLLWLSLQASPFAQEEGDFIIVEELGGRKVPRSLLNVISVDLNEVTFREALSAIAEKGEVSLNYNRDRIPVQRKVSVKMKNVRALEALLHILSLTGTELHITSEGQLAVVPSKDHQMPKGTVKGQVLDRETKVPLIGANVTFTGTKMGAASDYDGKFTIENVPVGSYTVQFSYIGYKPLSQTDVIIRSKRITFLKAELKASPVEMQQVVATSGFFSQTEEQPISLVNFSAEEIRRAPGVMGDVSRILSGVPGVARVNDSFNSLIVRGGSATENTFFVDHIEMPNINHFPVQGTSGGFISFFNGDLIRNVNFYSGGFSAIYGDRLSSIMDIALREGNREEFDMQFDLHFAGVGSIAEGPLGQRMGSWLLSARRTFLDLLFEMSGEEGNVPVSVITRPSWSMICHRNINCVFSTFWDLMIFPVRGMML